MFSDDFNRDDGALGNGWGHNQGPDQWTISSNKAVSGTCTGRNPNMSQSLTHLGTRLRNGFRFGFRWQHSESIAETIVPAVPGSPGMIFTLDPAGTAGLGQWEVKPQISDGHIQYQFQFWGGDLGPTEYNPVSANNEWHDVEYIVYPTELTLIVDGVTLADRVTHEMDLSVFDNPILSFFCEGNEGPGIDPQFMIDSVYLFDFGSALAINRVSNRTALIASRTTNSPSQ